MPTNAAVAAGLLDCTTVGNTVDLTVPGFGTVTAAIVFASNANTGSNPQSSAALSVGYWTPASQCVTALYAHHGGSGGSTQTSRGQQSGIVASGMTAASGSVVSFWTATGSPITNGIRLTVASTSSGATRYVYALLISCEQAYIGSQNLGTGTSAIAITAPGFKPSFVALATSGQGTDNIAEHAIASFGVAHNSSADVVRQGFVAFASTDALSTSQSSIHISNTHCVTQHYQDATSWQASASNFTSSGFSLTPSANSGSDVVYYLALRFADPNDAWVGVVDSKTSTGTQAYTGTGFTPKALMLWQTLNTAVGITQGSSLSMGATDGATSRSLSVRDQDASSSFLSSSEADLSNPLFIEFNDGTTDAVAAWQSFDSDGWTLNYSDGSASARKMLAFAIGDSTAGGAPTVTALSAIGITASSAQPRISYS